MSNCSTSSPSSLPTTQEQDQNQENEPQSISTLTKEPNDQTQLNSTETISTPNRTYQSHNFMLHDADKYVIHLGPFLKFLSTKENMIKEEWERMSDEDKKPYNEMFEKEEEERKRKEEEKKLQKDSPKPRFSFNSTLIKKNLLISIMIHAK